MTNRKSLSKRLLARIHRTTEMWLRDKKSSIVPTKYVNTLRNIESCTGSVNGKSILEVGSDPAGTFMAYLDRERKIARGVGINPCLIEEKTFGSIELRKIDARKIPLPDNQFDLVTSTSVLEHVQDLNLALDEMYRVLRPGGYLWAGFGPIWSSCWGHHLWFYHRDQVVDWRTHKLPPYAHLLMSESELSSWCHEAYRDSELTEKIVEFVYHSPDQNRLFYSDYEKLVRDSPFETVFFVGVPDVPLLPGYECADSRKLFRDLRGRYPDKSGFGYHLIWMVLSKPE